MHCLQDLNHPYHPESGDSAEHASRPRAHDGSWNVPLTFHDLSKEHERHLVELSFPHEPFNQRHKRSEVDGSVVVDGAETKVAVADEPLDGGNGHLKNEGCLMERERQPRCLDRAASYPHRCLRGTR
jgi:hypothetical protein